MTKQQKQQIVEALANEWTNEVSIYVCDYKGSTHKELEALRNAIREAEGKVQVVKNNLARLALAKNGVEASYEDNNIFIWGEDQISLAKLVVKHAEAHKDVFKVKSAVIEGEVKDADYVIEVSKLPTKDELLGMVAYMMKAPLTKFAYGLQNLIEKKSEEE
ncbi:MAG: 50S ribosomal protein L10 [Epsilonproteobacteria bacterium]|nr:50S ribosomal protein L10 [Campylobacterota bacterium]